MTSIERREIAAIVVSVIPDIVEALIERMDEQSGDCDLEDDDPDQCMAGDDHFYEMKRKVNDYRLVVGGEK